MKDIEVAKLILKQYLINDLIKIILGYHDKFSSKYQYFSINNKKMYKDKIYIIDIDLEPDKGYEFKYYIWTDNSNKYSFYNGNEIFIQNNHRNTMNDPVYFLSAMPTETSSLEQSSREVYLSSNSVKYYGTHIIHPTNKKNLFTFRMFSANTNYSMTLKQLEITIIRLD